ncbi:MAG: ROK family protein, partial [Kiritimatiellia bacterium]
MSKQKSAKTHWLGIDLGGTKILAGVYDQDFKLVGCKKRKTKPELGQEACLERLMRTSQEALQDAKIEKEQLGGVGIGCPGVLDLESGILVKAPNLGWIDVPVQKLLEKEFGVPAAVTNDVDAGTFGEYRCGAGKGGSTVFGIFPGTGIGGALIYGGKIYRSKTGSCMEIGHLQAIPNGPLCGCGRNGCLEAVAGRLAISAAASIAVVRGQAPWLQEHAGSDPVNLRSGTLAAA